MITLSTSHVSRGWGHWSCSVWSRDGFGKDLTAASSVYGSSSRRWSWAQWSEAVWEAEIGKVKWIKRGSDWIFFFKMPLWSQAVEQHKQIHCAIFVLRNFQPWPGEALRIWSDLRAGLLWAGGWTRDPLRSLPVWTILWSCSCPPDRLLETSLSLFAFSEFWSQLNSRIKSTMVRKSCEIVLSLSAPEIRTLWQGTWCWRRFLWVSIIVLSILTGHQLAGHPSSSV